MGVTSEMFAILKPMLCSERTADSRPGPGPLTCTSRFFTPYSCAAMPAFSAATCAANGVDLREPRKPEPPEVAQHSTLPWRSVMVMMVLLNDACTCAMPSTTVFLTFLRGAPAAGAVPAAAASPSGAAVLCVFSSAMFDPTWMSSGYSGSSRRGRLADHRAGLLAAALAGARDRKSTRL